jgi:hypothetical protein
MLMALAQSCDDTGTSGDLDNEHEINALFSHDATSGKLTVYVEVWRDGEPFVGATVTLDTIKSVPSAGEGKFATAFNRSEFGDTVQLDVRSVLDAFNFRALVAIPDSFSLDIGALPGGVVRSSTENVKLVWSQSRLEDGYLVVVDPPNTANPSVGYSRVIPPTEYVVEGQLLVATIPNTAFRDSQGVFQPGDYEVWLAAFRGSPINYPILPFALPDEFGENVNRVGVTGSIGAIYIPEKRVLSAVTGD